MTTDAKTDNSSININLNQIGLVISIILGILSMAGGVSAWIILPEKVKALEIRTTEELERQEGRDADQNARIKALEDRERVIMDLLSRIDENVNWLKVQMNR